MQPLRVIFMGTPDFAAAALKALDKSVHEIIAVYSQPPRPKGRGHKLQRSPVHEYADEHGIPVFTPKSLKNEQAQEEFSSLRADIAVVAAYGLILPKAVLEAPRYGCLNIHASLLPRWRGASPIQHAILSGDAESGVTIMQMDEGLDTGPMIAEVAVPITLETTASDLHDALAAEGAGLIVEVLDALARNGHVHAHPQDDARSTYAPMLKKDDGRIDWTQSAGHIDRQVRALNPWPGTWSEAGEKRLKILKVEMTDQNTDQPPGTLLDRKGHIACGTGQVLRLVQVQPAGKAAMDAASSFNGGYIQVGSVLE